MPMHLQAAKMVYIGRPEIDGLLGRTGKHVLA